MSCDLKPLTTHLAPFTNQSRLSFFYPSTVLKFIGINPETLYTKDVPTIRGNSMSFKKSVVIFGRSLNLVGIGACLKREEGLDVFEIDPQDPGARQRLEALEPEVILFDLADPPNDLDLAFFRRKPGLILIGVDPSSDEVLFLKGQRSKVVTAGELTKLIANHNDDKFVKKRD
jgi:hypothetical protein